ncbi:MAG: tetratricopeptide repeat protein [Bacteroidia bacterium]|nr:tetratricopeptide repeat protein [Bacteroidia bacterium]
MKKFIFVAIGFIFFSFPTQAVWGQYDTFTISPQQRQAISKLRLQLESSPVTSPMLASRQIDFAKLHISHRPDTALKYFRLALQGASTKGQDELLPEIHLNLGHIFSRFGAYSTALEHYLIALDRYKDMNNLPGLAETHNALGNLYYFTKQTEDALGRHQKALEISRQEGLPRLEARTLGYLGHFYEKQADYDRALNYQQLALEKYKELDDPQGLSAIYGNLGSINEDLENYEKAYEYFALALQYNLQTDDEESRIIHLNDIGDTFRKRGDFAKGLKFTTQALELALKLENPYQEKSAKRDLAKNLAEIGDFDEAYSYMVQAYDLHEELYNGKEANQIARMESLHEINRTQREIDALKNEKRLASISFFSWIAGLSLLILLLLLWVSRQRLKERKDRELLETRQALITQELENSQLREKQLESDLEARSGQLSSHALSIVQKNKILKDIKTRLIHLNTNNTDYKEPIANLIQKIDEGFEFDKDWTKFNQIFKEVHPSFYRLLNEKYPSMTASEIRLCALLRLNLDSKDIAAILGISQDSLRVARYRLRKKLQLKKGENLVGFIMNI